MTGISSACCSNLSCELLVHRLQRQHWVHLATRNAVHETVTQGLCLCCVSYVASNMKRGVTERLTGPWLRVVDSHSPNGQPPAGGKNCAPWILHVDLTTTMLHSCVIMTGYEAWCSQNWPHRQVSFVRCADIVSLCVPELRSDCSMILVQSHRLFCTQAD